MDRNKIENYMMYLSLNYEEIGENTWLIRDKDKGLEQVVVIYEEPVVIIRVKVMELPKENREPLFEELLRLNASDIVHGAYAVEDNSVIIVDTLVYETMDLEEIQASLDAIGLSLSQHYNRLSKYRV